MSLNYIDQRDGQEKPVPSEVIDHWGVKSPLFYQSLHTAFISYHRYWAERMNPGDPSTHPTAFPMNDDDWSF